MNDLKDYLKRQGLVTKREENTRKPGAYLFPGVNGIIKVGDYGRIETCIYGREK
jgi:hypothetical protein